jgi:hypothetical protein
VRFSETSVNIYRNTKRYYPDGSILQRSVSFSLHNNLSGWAKLRVNMFLELSRAHVHTTSHHLPQTVISLRGPPIHGEKVHVVAFSGCNP